MKYLSKSNFRSHQAKQILNGVVSLPGYNKCGILTQEQLRVLEEKGPTYVRVASITVPSQGCALVSISSRHSEETRWKWLVVVPKG